MAVYSSSHPSRFERRRSHENVCATETGMVPKQSNTFDFSELIHDVQLVGNSGSRRSYHSFNFLKRELSPKVAMLGTLTVGITSSGVLFWAVSSPALCASHITSSFASTLMILVLVLLAFRMCTQADTRKPSTNETSLLFSLISKNKKAVFLTPFVALVCSTLALFQFLGTVVTCVYAPQRYADFPHGVGFIQKIFFLNIIWFVVGIGLPVIFRQLINLSFNAKEISDDNHLHNMKMPILA